MHELDSLSHLKDTAEENWKIFSAPNGVDQNKN